MREHAFSAARAVEAILFLAWRLQEPTIHEVLKLRYFADKLHLERYGVPASGDSYSALEFGPVASETYNILKSARGERSRWIDPDYSRLISGAFQIRDRLFVVPQRDANEGVLSPADVECLARAIEVYGDMSFKDRTRISHDDAWRKAWKEAVAHNAEAANMPLVDVVRTLDNAEEILDYLNS